MITWRGIAGNLLGVGVAFVLFGCGTTTSYRYKMTIEVETPEGIRTGSAVREVQYFEPGNFPSIGESRPRWGVKGEAVTVDFPAGKMLFALLTSGDGVVDYAGRDIDHMFRELGGKHIQLWPNPPRTMAPRIYDPLPMLVVFADIKDPMSMQRVDPDELAASFGSGYKLQSITVSATTEPVTTRIQKRLGWLKRVDNYEFGRDGPFYKNFPSEVQYLKSK